MVKKSNKQQSTINTESNNGHKIQKFQSLKANNTYSVISYSEPIKSKYGVSYILSIRDVNSKEETKIWSTRLLAKYIKTKKPQKKFIFMVFEDVDKSDNNLYPVIEGYEPLSFNELESDTE